jgi:hypothetical protein
MGFAEEESLPGHASEWLGHKVMAGGTPANPATLDLDLGPFNQLALEVEAEYVFPA